MLNLERAAKLWNSKHDEVKIKIATAAGIFQVYRRKIRFADPDLSRANGRASGRRRKPRARVSARIGRYNHDHAPAAETLWSALAMTRRLPFPVGNFTADLRSDVHLRRAQRRGQYRLASAQQQRAAGRTEPGIRGVYGSGKADTDEMFSTGITALASLRVTKTAGPQLTRTRCRWSSTTGSRGSGRMLFVSKRRTRTFA